MTELFQYGLFLAVVILLVKPVGLYLARVFEAEKTWLDPLLRPVESGIYRLAGVDPARGMDWKEYASSFVLFGFLGTGLLYGILRLQFLLPWFFPKVLTTPTPDLAMNTAVSFATTTTWQAYAGESTMSYFSQVTGLAAQNFLAGAAGLAVGIAFIRGFSREGNAELGNFWVDLVRATLWVLLPISILGSLVLVWQGVPANFNPYVEAATLQGATQLIPQGPVAVLEFIKNLGTNGGGFFNANGAHPYENPTPLTNFIELLAIAVPPAALTYTFGRMTGAQRQGWTIFWVMALLFVTGVGACQWAEQAPNPALAQIDAAILPGGNLEGKETRFGVGASVLAAITTSNGATGSYNAMHDSFNPLGGLVPLVNMLLGEIVFGGLGTGLFSFIMVALVGLFVGSLMVGRAPEYLGKRLGPAQIKLVSFYAVLAPTVILLLTALAVVSEPGRAGLTTNAGAHGFTEIFFAYTSAASSNGQNFAGLSANSPFYNITIAVAMVVGRYGLVIVALALAGTLAPQRRRPATAGTLPTDTPLFALLLTLTVAVLGALSYLPALAVGPLVEHLLASG